MPFPVGQPVQYSTVKEIIAIFNLPTGQAEKLLAKTMTVLEHGGCEPDGVAEKEDRVQWVAEGLDKLVGISLQRSRLY
jgi:hypothetical protein